MTAQFREVDDPDKRIKFMRVTTPYEVELISKIKKKGSVNVYMMAETVDKDLTETFIQNGFHISAAERVMWVTENSELGDMEFNRFQTMLDMYFHDFIVVGDTSGDLCSNTYKKGTMSDFDDWMESMFRECDRNKCYLLAYFTCHRNLIVGLMSQLFANVRVTINNNNITINLKEIRYMN